MRTIIGKIAIVVLTLFSAAVFSEENTPALKSRDEIINLLQKWSQDFNAKKIPETCDLFAPDLVSSYPGTKDRNYEQMCSHLTEILSDKDRIIQYEAPKLEQIWVNGDLAVVRLIWTLKTSNKEGEHFKIINEKGLDIFSRQPDGTWKISISYAHPIQD